MVFYAKMIDKKERERTMQRYESDYVIGYKKMKIPYTLEGANEYTERLAIMLPGAGYTSQAPLFHYASSMFLESSIDVLKINYPYNGPFYDDFSWEELSRAINHDVSAVLDHVLPDKGYRQYILLAKSIGTLSIESILDKTGTNETKAIWVTPLLKEERVANLLADSRQQTLCIIGDKDPHYISEQFERIKQNPFVTTRLISHMHHSLEREGHILESIDVLKSIINDIRDFI